MSKLKANMMRLGWLLLKQKVTTVGEHLEKLEPSCTTGGDMK